jgi:hypothetical protein
MSNQQVVNVSVQLFNALDRKDKLARELEHVEKNISLYRAFLEGHGVAVQAAAAAAAAAAAVSSSPAEGSGTVADVSQGKDALPAVDGNAG